MEIESRGVVFASSYHGSCDRIYWHINEDAYTFTSLSLEALSYICIMS